MYIFIELDFFEQSLVDLRGAFTYRYADFAQVLESIR